jgi:hypothetical protein
MLSDLGKKLERPYVYFGTVKKGITIIPDDILERDGPIRVDS